MKHIKYTLASFSILLTTLLLLSCENEPLDPAIDVSGNSSVVGSYFITAFNTSVPTDLNQDGTASSNQLNETTCFDGNYILLNPDNTFTANSKGIDITTNGTDETITCFVDPDINGTWSLSGDQLSLTYTEAGEQFTDIFTVSGSTLTLSINDGEIVGVTSTGDPVYLNADIDIIFTKQ
ncbi:lipocalin family protein [Flavobacterium cucumis]|uniref:Lipocalin-like domain-containing protein n=1 Tax=Flavobacterium cucumis TaxID=416016 RepID=A0A1M7ZX45_9FLAO|nr:lipocalin family protein [Flavobacterium cucumis]SHO73431.1 Lipocalin-like domain-containing protein [Flavobacterium cucumis]